MSIKRVERSSITAIMIAGSMFNAIQGSTTNDDLVVYSRQQTRSPGRGSDFDDENEQDSRSDSQSRCGICAKIAAFAAVAAGIGIGMFLLRNREAPLGRLDGASFGDTNSTSSPVPTPTAMVTPTPMPTATVTFSPTPRPVLTPTAMATPTPMPTATVTFSPTPRPTPTPTAMPTPTPRPTPTPTATPTPAPKPIVFTFESSCEHIPSWHILKLGDCRSDFNKRSNPENMKAEGYVQVGQPGTLKVGKQSYCLDKGDWVLKEYAKQVEPTFGACAIRDFK